MLLKTFLNELASQIVYSEGIDRCPALYIDMFLPGRSKISLQQVFKLVQHKTWTRLKTFPTSNLTAAFCLNKHFSFLFD